MTSETIKLKAKLTTLSSSLDDLEAHLAPLFSQTLPETIVGLETIQQAKLNTVLPYLVYDLVFIYLKSKGIDPKTHPVFTELDRVRQYFNKITSAEDPAKKRTVVDKAAADRFIKHAITQAKNATIPDDRVPLSPNLPKLGTTVPLPTKVTSKMRERARYEKELKNSDDGDEEATPLEVWDDGPDHHGTSMNIDGGGEVKKSKKAKKATKEKGKSKAKGKAKEISEQLSPVAAVKEEIPKAGTKRRRPSIDPFAGYGDDIPIDEPTPSGKTESRVDPGTDTLNIDMTTTSELTSNKASPAPPGSSKKKSRKKA